MDPRRHLPSVERVIAQIAHDGLPHELFARAARDAVGAARALVERGRTIAPEDVVADARERAATARARLLGPVVNATGVLLHTNLGRAPLGTRTVAAMADVAAYSNLEYRMPEGVRGSRHEHAGHLLALAVGAEAGMVVNNNAAAVLLVLATLARGREVVVSRGELVEIGGGFRVPEIMAETGARLVEVGTTNRTRRDDYERAIGEATALVLKVHASNYRMVGFVASVGVAELAGLGPPVVVDAGSGLLDDTTPWLAAAAALAAGRARRSAVRRRRRGARHVLGRQAARRPPGGCDRGSAVARGTVQDPPARPRRARRQADARRNAAGGARVPRRHRGRAPALATRHHAGRDAAGPRAADRRARARRGGRRHRGRRGRRLAAGPDDPVGGVAVAPARPPAAVTADLRRARVVARIDGGRVVCDLRTVEPHDDERLVAALREATAAGG
ncbi:MAG: hypothetical protein KatS3mg009_0682 [Acidimicrobiia bacterium]|nr:MAG: hypothetical protein KatS3mg009_0682 [Acidimicrobiia bacterium]